MFFRNLLCAAVLLSAVPVWAGPPLICHPIDIGDAKSLPWVDTKEWQGTDPTYNVAKLTGDTLALLSPGTPTKVRMETMRRAAIYASKDARLADELTARLLARTLDTEAAGKPDPNAWFDAGYFVETLRQATFIYRYNMLTPAERTAWRLRKGPSAMDGYPWVQKAIRMGGKDMAPTIALMEEYRAADLRASLDGQK